MHSNNNISEICAAHAFEHAQCFCQSLFRHVVQTNDQAYMHVNARTHVRTGTRRNSTLARFEHTRSTSPHMVTMPLKRQDAMYLMTCTPNISLSTMACAMYTSLSYKQQGNFHLLKHTRRQWSPQACILPPQVRVSVAASSQRTGNMLKNTNNQFKTNCTGTIRIMCIGQRT
jgi:hypothetical protein